MITLVLPDSVLNALSLTKQGLVTNAGGDYDPDRSNQAGLVERERPGERVSREAIHPNTVKPTRFTENGMS